MRGSGRLPAWLDAWEREGQLDVACCASLSMAFAFAQVERAYDPESDDLMGRVFERAAAAVATAEPEDAVRAGTEAVLAELEGFRPRVVRPSTEGQP